MCLPLVLLFTYLGLPPENVLQTLWVWPLLAAAGFLHGLLTPMSLRQIAHEADQHNGLQDRLLTCVGQIQSRRPPTVVSQLLLQETLERLDGIDPRGTFPSTWRRPLLRWLVPALGIVAVFVVAPRVLPVAEDPVKQEVMASHQRLSQLAKKLAATRPRSRQHQQLQELLRKMPQQVPAQAARQMRDALQKVQRQVAEGAAAARQLEQIAKGEKGPGAQRQQLELVRKGLGQQPEVQKLVEQAQKSLEQGQKEAAEKALQQAQKELLEGDELSQALQQELHQLGGQDAPGEGELAAKDVPMPGKGRGKADFGTGSSNEAGKSGDPAKAKARSHRQNQQQRHKVEQFQRLYGAERKHLKTRRERVALAGGKGKLLRLSDSQLGEARHQDPSLRPEQEDFLEAKALAEQSVAEERVPPEHREAVRRYFDQIDPR
ncbi:hypothetical protein IV102_08785 [bacterium]|nr:hypothetical protein [bacterium]